jgi:hypothetical protein
MMVLYRDIILSDNYRPSLSGSSRNLQHFDVLGNVMCVCEPKENIFRVFFKYGKSKRLILPAVR